MLSELVTQPTYWREGHSGKVTVTCLTRNGMCAKSEREKEKKVVIIDSNIKTSHVNNSTKQKVILVTSIWIFLAICL